MEQNARRKFEPQCHILRCKLHTGDVEVHFTSRLITIFWGTRALEFSHTNKGLKIRRQGPRLLAR